MDQENLIPVREVNGLQFYKYPYSEILIATMPLQAINDLWKIWTMTIRDDQSAAQVLQVLVDKGRKTGIQIFLYIESLDILPEAHRLTFAVLSADNKDKVYHTPPSGQAYSFQNLLQLFGR